MYPEESDIRHFTTEDLITELIHRFLLCSPQIDRKETLQLIDIMNKSLE